MNENGWTRWALWKVPHRIVFLLPFFSMLEGPVSNLCWAKSHKRKRQSALAPNLPTIQVKNRSMCIEPSRQSNIQLDSSIRKGCCNLNFNWIEAINLSNAHYSNYKYMRLTTPEMAVQMTHFQHPWWSRWHSWWQLLVKRKVVHPTSSFQHKSCSTPFLQFDWFLRTLPLMLDSYLILKKIEASFEQNPAKYFGKSLTCGQLLWNKLKNVEKLIVFEN